MKSSFVLCALVAWLSASGCGLIKNLEEMHDSTGKLAKSMTEEGGMSEKMNEMADTTSKMSETTQAMGDNTRQGVTLAIRQQMLDRMDATSDMQRKIFLAGAYFCAFEFQVWSGKGEDTLERREELLKEAVEEFFRTVSDYAGLGRNLSTRETDVKKTGLYALSVALHKTNANQGGAQKYSFLRMIKDTIEAQKAGQSLKPWQKELATHLGRPSGWLAQHLLLMRMNFLATMTLAKISRVQTMSDLEKLFSMKWGRWDALLSDLSAPELETYTTWLTEANSLAAFLKATHNTAKLDSNLFSVLSNMRYDLASLQRNSPSARAVALGGFVGQFESLLKIGD